MMQISNLYGTFSVEFKIESETGIVTIHPEMRPVKTGIAPTLRYHIYGIHPIHASFTLIVEQDENGEWFSIKHPPFILKEFIVWLPVA